MSANLCVGPTSASNPLLGFRKAGHLHSKGKPAREFTQRLCERVTKLGSIETREHPLQLGPHARNKFTWVLLLENWVLEVQTPSAELRWVFDGSCETNRDSGH